MHRANVRRPGVRTCGRCANVRRATCNVRRAVVRTCDGAKHARTHAHRVFGSGVPGCHVGALAGWLAGGRRRRGVCGCGSESDRDGMGDGRYSGVGLGGRTHPRTRVELWVAVWEVTATVTGMGDTDGSAWGNARTHACHVFRSRGGVRDVMLMRCAWAGRGPRRWARGGGRWRLPGWRILMCRLGRQ